MSEANPATNFVMNLMRLSTKEVVRNIENMVPIIRRFWRHGPDSFSVSDVDRIGAHHPKQLTGMVCDRHHFLHFNVLLPLWLKADDPGLAVYDV
jgi:hypothetical protein